MHDYLANSLPALPQCAKKAVADLVESRPHFHPLSGWTHVKQLHGHKVTTAVFSFVRLHFASFYITFFWEGCTLHLMQCIPWHHRLKGLSMSLSWTFPSGVRFSPSTLTVLNGSIGMICCDDMQCANLQQGTCLLLQHLFKPYMLAVSLLAG